VITGLLSVKFGNVISQLIDDEYMLTGNSVLGILTGLKPVMLISICTSDNLSAPGGCVFT